MGRPGAEAIAIWLRSLLLPSLPITSYGPLPLTHKATIAPWENWIMTAHNKVKETSVQRTGTSVCPAKPIYHLCTRHWLNMDVDTEYCSWYTDPYPAFPASVPLFMLLPRPPRSTSMPPLWNSHVVLLPHTGCNLSLFWPPKEFPLYHLSPFTDPNVCSR